MDTTQQVQEQNPGNEAGGQEQVTDQTQGGNEGGGAEQPPKIVTTRDALTAALKASKEGANAETPAAQAAKQPETPPATAKPGEQQQQPGDPNAAQAALKPTDGPKGWPAHLRPEFAKLPPALQAFINHREESFARTVAAQDQDRNFGKVIKEITTPYTPIFQAENTTPEKAVASLLNMAYIVRRGTMAQKVQLIQDTIRDFGIQMPQGTTTGQPGQGNPQNAELFQLRQQVAALTQRLTGRERSEQEALQAKMDDEVATFAADTEAHPHFELVADFMIGLLNSGTAKDLQDAYEQAVWLRPELRETLISQQVADKEAKRKQEGQAKVQAARKAGSSIAGSPGGKVATAPKNNKNMTTREAIVAAMEEVRGNS